MAAKRSAKKKGPKWAHDLYKTLRKGGITQFGYVPDAGHAVLIDNSIADPDAHSVSLTTEEEGVGLAMGAHLGGAKGVLLMQSSGLGNCINMFTLIKGGNFPFLTLISMRGDYGEGNRWQLPMGQWTQPILETCGFYCLKVEDPKDVVPTAEAAMTMAFQSEAAVAVLLGQKLIGAKKFS